MLYLKKIFFWFTRRAILLCSMYLWIFKKRNSIFILIFNKAAAINYFEHLFRSPLTCIQYNEFIYTPLLSSLMHTIVIILLNAYTIYFPLNWYSMNFLVYSWTERHSQKQNIHCLEYWNTCACYSAISYFKLSYLLVV